MGACASCLGLERHPSRETDETNALLDDHQARYGGLSDGEVSQPDEAELRREREALERITAEATDNMIDVLHPANTELSQRFAPTDSQRSTSRSETPDNVAHDSGEVEDGEAAWLKSVQAENADIAAVKGFESGRLVWDVSQLRNDRSTPTSRKSTKGKLPT